MTESKPTGSATNMQPSPHWTTETTRDDAGWIVTARWWGEKGEPASDGPREVVIRLADNASPDVRQRGVNSGVMRRLEHHVNDMAAEVHDMPSVGAYAVMARRYVEDRLAQLPAGPREGGDVYYRGLLELFEDVTAKGHPEPVNLLSTVMGIPKDTLKTRLRTARQRRGTTQAPPK